MLANASPGPPNGRKYRGGGHPRPNGRRPESLGKRCPIAPVALPRIDAGAPRPLLNAAAAGVARLWHSSVELTAAGEDGPRDRGKAGDESGA